MQSQTASKISIESSDYIKIRDLIYKNSGMFFPENKKYFLVPKFQKRIEALELSSFMDYYSLLQSPTESKEEWSKLFDEITVNETFFFRDQPQLEAFESHVLIPLIEERKKQNKTIRIWSAACSTGEEAYTIAIILLANLKLNASRFDIRILASDISNRTLALAKEGVYNARSVQYVPDKYLDKYFTAYDNKFKINDSVKQLVTFTNANLMNKNQYAHLPSQDIIFCRNVLIYFNDTVRREVVKNLHNKLDSSGYLFTGYSESLHNISNDFKIIFFNRSKAYKKD
jgi:chemotaxis protein methyltransferase CheR